MRFNLQKISNAIIAIAVCQALGIVGAALAAPSVSNWFLTLEKPVTAPPLWVLNPLWLFLYTLMGLSLAKLYEQGWSRHAVKVALASFAFLLVFNAARPFLFFGLHNLFAAFVDGILQVIAIAVTMRLAFRVSRPAAWLLLPTLLWVFVSLYFNYSLWLLNT